MANTKMTAVAKAAAAGMPIRPSQEPEWMQPMAQEPRPTPKGGNNVEPGEIRRAIRGALEG